MKKLKLISVLLVLTLALTSFPFFAIADNAENSDITIENFDGNTSVITENSREHVSISEDYAESGTKSLKLSTAGMTLEEYTNVEDYYWTAEINPTNKNADNANYMRFWVKNTTGKQLKLDFVPSNGTQLNTSNAPYYFKNSVGDVWTKNAQANSDYYSRGVMLIPADFTGYVYVPKTSYKNFSINGQMRIFVDVRDLQNGALYIDSISFTDSLPTLNLHVNFDTVGDYTLTTGDGVEITDKYSYSGSNSLKFTEDQILNLDKDYKYAKIENFNLIDTTGTGIKMWINNTASNAVYLTAANTSENKMKSDMGCYLEDDSGNVFTNTVVNSGYYDYYAIQIPANFKGWLYLRFGNFSNANLFTELRLFVRQTDLKTGALYIDSIRKFFEIPTSNLCENFDYNTNITDKTYAGYATISNDYSKSGENSLKLTSENVTYDKSYWSVDIVPSYNPAVGDGIRLWLKNTTGNNIKLDIAPDSNTQLKTGSVSYLTEDGKNFFLSRTKPNTDNYSRGIIIIPADFEGFVYIPFASFSAYNLSCFRIQLDKDDVAKGALYVDSISYYSGYVHNVEHMSGDCNYDGVVDIRDLVKLDNYLDGNDYYIDIDAADLNGSYTVNVDDMTALRNKLLGN